MAIDIVLNDAKITSIILNYERNYIQVNYDLLDASGVVWKSSYFIAWIVIPIVNDPEGNPMPIPNNWYTIPADKYPILTNIKDYITAIIVQRIESGLV